VVPAQHNNLLNSARRIDRAPHVAAGHRRVQPVDKCQEKMEN
jgi:hypothetical protein